MLLSCILVSRKRKWNNKQNLWHRIGRLLGFMRPFFKLCKLNRACFLKRQARSYFYWKSKIIKLFAICKLGFIKLATILKDNISFRCHAPKVKLCTEHVNRMQFDMQRGLGIFQTFGVYSKAVRKKVMFLYPEFKLKHVH